MHIKIRLDQPEREEEVNKNNHEIKQCGKRMNMTRVRSIK